MACDVPGCATDGCTPDNLSFACKARYWRFSPGSLGVRYAGGRDFFHDVTIKENVEENLRLARANGRQPEPVTGPSPVPVSALGAI